MAISRAQALKELVPGLNALFGLEYKKYENEHLDIYEVENSDRSFEEELKLSGFAAAPVKTEGGAIEWDEAQESFTARYNHETIAMGFAITEEAIEDNLYDKLSARYTKALARSMAYTKQVKAAAWLNGGFSGTVFVSGDGVTLFSTAHPTVSALVNANRPTTAADMNETSLENAVIEISEWKDERGLLISAMPRKLILPTELQFTATRLTMTEGRVGTADNDLNALKKMGSFPEGHCINHHLTDPDAWFIKTDVPNGMKHFNRIGIKTGEDGDFVTGNIRYKARERYSFGVSDPLGMYASPGE